MNEKLHVDVQKPCWTRFSNSKIIAACIILTYLFFGTVFYKQYDGMSWSHGYYFAVTAGLKTGCTTPTTDIDKFSKIFTISFKLFGIFVQAVLYTNIFRSNCFQTVIVRHNRFCAAVAAVVLLMIIAVFWSYYIIGWSFVSCVYFMFSSFWWWGIFSVPLDSSDSEFIVCASLTVLGGMAVLVVYAFLASDVEIRTEKYMLRMVSVQPFDPSELGLVLTLSGGGSVVEEGFKDDDSASSGGAKPVVNERIAKHILLSRLLRVNDLSRVYFQLRMSLGFGFFLLLVLGTVFFRYYDSSPDWSLAANYSLSSVYKLGYSSNDVDGFSQMVSASLMLGGSVLLNTLTIAIIREFSLKRLAVRYFHIVLGAFLCAVFVILATAMFIDNYGFTWVHSVGFALDIMVGHGGSVPWADDPVVYWVLNVYTAAAVPLFAAFVSHLDVELDVGDYSGYMNHAIARYFTQEEMRLLSLFEQHHHRTDAFGLFELHVLLILRLKEMRDMERLLYNLNEAHGVAVQSGMVPTFSANDKTPSQAKSLNFVHQSECSELENDLDRESDRLLSSH